MSLENISCLKKIRTALETKQQSGIFSLDLGLPVDTIQGIVESSGFRFLYLDGTPISTNEEFRIAITVLTRYPYAAGPMVWDAIYDYMAEGGDIVRHLPSARGYVFLYDHFEKFAQADEQFFTAKAILTNIADLWIGEGRMYIFLRGDRQFIPEFESFCQDNGH